MNKIEVPPQDQAEDKRWWQLSVELKDHRRKLDRITTYLVIIAIMLGMLFVSHFGDRKGAQKRLDQRSHPGHFD